VGGVKIIDRMFKPEEGKPFFALVRIPILVLFMSIRVSVISNPKSQS